MKEYRRKASLVCSLIVIGLVVVSCQSTITISMTADNPPTFRFHRHFLSDVNTFPLFIVEEIHPDNQSVGYLQQQYAKNKTIWRVVTDLKPPNYQEVDKVPPIIYGEVPSGFLQEIPALGPPPKLEAGRLYEASGAYVLMPDAIVRFKIEGGKIQEVPIPQ